MTTATLETKSTSAAFAAALVSFLSHLTHELNNHLATVRGKAELGLMVADPSRHKQALGDVLEASGRAERLAADLQRLSHWAGAGASAVQLDDLLQLVERLLQRAFQRSSVTLVLEPGPPCSLETGAAELAIALCLLVQSALESRRQRQPVVWRVLGIRNQKQSAIVQFETEGVDWSSLLAPNAALDEPESSEPIRHSRRCLAEAQAEARWDGERLQLTLRGAR